MRPSEIQENDVVVLLPRTLRKVRQRLLWIVQGVSTINEPARRVWPCKGGTLSVFKEHVIVRRPGEPDLFADYIVLPGHKVKDLKRDLSIVQSWCCKAHLTGPYTDVCCRHRLDAEALRLAGM
jgi:hypothetical protein